MNANRFQMVAYTGAVLETLFWGKLVIDIEGIQVDARLPALREHQRDRAVGIVDRITKGSELRAEGFFVKSTPDGQECQKLLNEGFPFQASVGIWVRTIEKLKADESAEVNGGAFKGPGVIWRESHVREISFVALGADAKTKISKIAASAQGINLNPKREEVTIMHEHLNERPDEVFAGLANQLVSEEGLSYSDASTRIAKERPELMRAFRVSLENPDSELNDEPVSSLVKRSSASGDVSNSGEPADDEISRLAMELVRTKGLEYHAAVAMVSRQRPDLVERYFSEG